MQLNGYYAGLVKSQIDDDDKKQISQINKKHSSVYSTGSSFQNEGEINDENVGIEIKKPKKVN